ncbi:hypothetical protein KC19_12G028900 [Ceratodon purpureus]|uniref:NusB/RsmB/TIM44 domain-containing protein n=1 Tax=Ceratodon purpureus TaxID=3225 RepID=A0A8T0G3J1_CERPU|nr:hypothetical protein KC19_12G028900 [Ceratodon purpureus]
MEAAMAMSQSSHGVIASLGSASLQEFRSSFLAVRLKKTDACLSCPCSRGRAVSIVCRASGSSSILAVSSEEESRPGARQKKTFSRTKKPYVPKPASVVVPKLDKFGRLRTPRAARELALSVLYAAFVSGVHPLKVFDERVRQRVVAHSFDKTQLEGYEHRPDVGANVVVEDEATAAALEEALEAEASLEAYVLTAPPPLVYNSFAIKLARSLVKETAERWLPHETILMEIIPAKWKAQPKGALLQICILQMALAEIETTDVPPGVVVNETVELSKRFCDLSAPRIINGCLGSYIRRRKIPTTKPAGSVSDKLERELVSEPLQPEDLGFAEDYAD